MIALRQGVNYAVAGATALDSSYLKAKGIQNPVTNASLSIELGWFKQSLPSLCKNTSDCRNLIGHSLILVGEIGGKDYNFPIFDKNTLDEIKAYVPDVIDTIISTINELIELGAKTLVVPGNFPVGCNAAYLTLLGSDREEYDPTTGCLIREIHPNVIIIYADYYNAAMKIYRSPHEYGFTNGALKSCCGGGGPYNYNRSMKCGYGYATMCDEPDTYFNWDGVHFTEAAYKYIFKGLFQGPYTTPPFSSLCSTPISQVRVGTSSSV
ncbi:SGNH hydrolase-type esterase domain-containing protein [Tanacetum coccineum]